MTKDELIAEAFKALENAYAPYSKYRVGACLLCRDDRIFYGANIENASYGATNCAERNAVFSAYSNGVRKDDIEALAIVCESGPLGSPCGICRQVLSELLNSDTPIYLANHEEEMVTNIAELLPNAFGMEHVLS